MIPRALVPIVAMLVACGGAQPEPQTARVDQPAQRRLPSREVEIAKSVHVALGIPRDSDSSDDYLMDKGVYVLSYHPRRKVANWVSWRLTREDLGSVDRRNDFRPDDELPLALYHVGPKDYLHSGYDRGHLCPSADRTRTAEENSRTFLMTNMHPQRGEMNQVTWKKVEEYERHLALDGKQLFIVAGGVFGPTPETIGNGVAVPSSAFKVIVSMKPGEGAHDVTGATETLSVLMPNTKEVKTKPWTEYVTSIDAIEAASGYDFLSAVSENVQAVLEARRASPLP